MASGAEPQQLDLLDWLAAQEPGPAPAEEPRRGSADPALAGAALVHLTRVDASCNMRRFYSLALAQSLWGEHGVVRQWGRIGAEGRKRTDWFSAPEAAAAELAKVVGRKRQRGYR